MFIDKDSAHFGVEPLFLFLFLWFEETFSGYSEHRFTVNTIFTHSLCSEDNLAEGATVTGPVNTVIIFADNDFGFVI